jgi:glutamate/tyrosine decarboxylase-like PLP-dependent enzyme
MAPGPNDASAPPPVPDLAWDAGRAEDFTHRMTSLWTELLSTLPERRIVPENGGTGARAALALAVPEEPMADDALFDHLRALAFDWAAYCGHPRFMAYITGAGTVPGVAADLLASGLNMNLGGWRLSPGATEIERSLIRWLVSTFGLPPAAGGLLVSGGAMANFTALKAARDHQLGLKVRSAGVGSAGPVAVYASSEVHVTTDRAVDMLGLGTDSLRRLPVDDGFRLRMDALREAVRVDKEDGIRPAIVVATAGTVATGAIDPLPEIAELCAQEGMWMHVDAAYGGPAVISDALRPLMRGIERADSVAFDPHKWMYTPHSGGCVLVRDEGLLQAAFDAEASYVHEDHERVEHEVDFARLGPQFSRGFQALKIWVSLLAHGRRAYSERIAHDVALAEYLAARVEAHPAFRLAAPVTLSICCFQYVPPDLPSSDAADQYLSDLNERIMTDLQLDGRVYISNAVLGERFVLRACVVNFRTEAGDMDAVLEVAEEIGARLDAELRPAALAGRG